MSSNHVTRDKSALIVRLAPFASFYTQKVLSHSFLLYIAECGRYFGVMNNCVDHLVLKNCSHYPVDNIVKDDVDAKVLDPSPFEEIP